MRAKRTQRERCPATPVEFNFLQEAILRSFGQEAQTKNLSRKVIAGEHVRRTSMEDVEHTGQTLHGHIGTWSTWIYCASPTTRI